MQTDIDIDLVYFWVDSTDPAWQAKKIEALKTVGGHTPVPLAARFRNHDELKFSLRSVAKHAPFIRNIYLITNQQRPTWLNSEAGGLFVVDHKDIFPDSALPCFSSNAIETVMHRICGLSEFFLYANDDMFFLNDISAEDFLLGNAKMLVGFKSTLVHIPSDPEHDPFSEQFVNSCQLMEVELGKFYRPRINLKQWLRLRPFRKNFYLWNYPNHQIQIVSKSIAYEMHDRFSREISTAMHEKFRSRHSIDVAGLLLYYAIYRGAAMPIYSKNWLMISRKWDPGRLLQTSRALIDTPPSHRPKFLCLNDCEYNEHFDWGSYVEHLMESLFPDPSRFEKTSAENRGFHAPAEIVRAVKAEKEAAQAVERSHLHLQDSWSVVNSLRNCCVSLCGS